MWFDNFKVGDKIAYNNNINYKRTGEILNFILTEELLNNIKKYEDDSNFHSMRIVNETNQ